MAVRAILHYPDPRLARRCDPVTVFDTALRMLALDLVDTLRAAPAIGLTAAHIDVPQRLVAIALDPQPEPRLFVNPAIVVRSEATAAHDEGSVSMPGAIQSVTRPATIRVTFADLDGRIQEEEMHGFMAACMQHEIDQLDGIFWLERLSKLKRDRLITKWQKSRR